MAKTYHFRFNAQKAEFGDAFVTVCYGGPETRLREEFHEMTWAGAQAHLVKFRDGAPGPSVCFVTCLDRPVPPGYHKTKTRLDKKS